MSKMVSKTVFMTGPDDKVAAVDVYAPPPVENINLGDSLAKSLAGTGDVVKKVFDPATIKKTITGDAGGSIGRLKSLISNPVPLTKKAAMAILAGGNIKDVLKEELDPLKLSILGDVLTKRSELLAYVAKGKTDLLGAGQKAGEDLVGKDIVMTINGINNVRKGADFKTATGVMGVLNSISGNPELAQVKFIGDRIGGLTAITGVVSQLRVPEAIDAIVNTIERKEDKQTYLTNNFETFVENCDMSAMELAIETAGTLSCLATVPNAPKLLLESYRYPEGFDKATMDDAVKLENLLFKLDPRWDQTRRNNVWISNIDIFTTASNQAIQTLALLPAYRVETFLAKSYFSTDQMVTLKQQFPLAAI